MSKFEYEIFYGDCTVIAFNKDKYTKEKAIEIAIEEFLDNKKPFILLLENAYVRHRAGINDDNEPCVGWWIEWEEHARSCPVYILHVACKSECKNLKKDCELIEVN